MASPNDSKYGYMIVVRDGASDNYVNGIPLPEDAEEVVYTSIEEAKAALMKMETGFSEFLHVAYSTAFPYENTTFNTELEKGFAPYGWAVVASEEGQLRICIGLLRILIR